MIISVLRSIDFRSLEKEENWLNAEVDKMIKLRGTTYIW